jgi:hypothetical protein
MYKFSYEYIFPFYLYQEIYKYIYVPNFPLSEPSSEDITNYIRYFGLRYLPRAVRNFLLTIAIANQAFPSKFLVLKYSESLRLGDSSIVWNSK